MMASMDRVTYILKAEELVAPIQPGRARQVGQMLVKSTLRCSIGAL